jgi:hypothetical protein
MSIDRYWPVRHPPDGARGGWVALLSELDDGCAMTIGGAAQSRVRTSTRLRDGVILLILMICTGCIPVQRGGAHASSEVDRVRYHIGALRAVMQARRWDLRDGTPLAACTVRRVLGPVAPGVLEPPTWAKPADRAGPWLAGDPTSVVPCGPRGESRLSGAPLDHWGVAEIRSEGSIIDVRADIETANGGRIERYRVRVEPRPAGHEPIFSVMTTTLGPERWYY